MTFEDEYNHARERFRDDHYISIDSWWIRINIKGLKNTPYEGGWFTFKAKFEKKNPLSSANIPRFYRLSEEDIRSGMTVREFKQKIHINGSILAIQLIFNGKVLPDRSKLSELGIHPRDRITIMATFAGTFIPQIWKKGKVYCETIIWHPNIDTSLPPGKVNFILGNKWNPNVDLSGLIEGLKKLIHMDPSVFDPQNALNKEAGEQYLNNLEMFNEKARKWTRRYAMRRF
ncbi:MAG: ubiquitin-conjugating enzyme E2 [Promethearchaeota archaeon]